jgi:hypothetical protein
MNKTNLTTRGILFCCLISIFSCKKTDLNTEGITGLPAGSYITDTILTVSPPVMYTRNALITDSNFIKSYVARLNLQLAGFPCTNCSFPFGTTTEAATLNLKIDFLSPTESTVTFSSGAKLNYVIQVDNNNRLFIRKDTIPLGSGNDECSQLTKKTFVYRSPYDTCFAIPTSSGISYTCRSTPLDFVISSDGNLYLPQVKSFTGKTTPNGNCSKFSVALTVFNSNLQSSLSPTDTVIVQQKRLNLRKL